MVQTVIFLSTSGNRMQGFKNEDEQSTKITSPSQTFTFFDLCLSEL